MSSSSCDITVTVNGRAVAARVDCRRLLSDFLRRDCALTGVHVGCEHGVCGACTVVLDGRTARSCCTLAVQADGAQIGTVEGMADRGTLHPLQEAFWRNHGLQCGFCTPGILMVARELLSGNSDPSDREIREALAGNICRCTGYQFIVDAIKEAAATMRAGAEPL
ncbi:MAG TPA: (2Fe-2S)-binding protein [Pseudonocardia sp.]|jgi:carbon-monoxide dehydrogenase small subunit|nr:(2Fe-2S)-binding protein [Pseudonocardia sp.]